MKYLLPFTLILAAAILAAGCTSSAPQTQSMATSGSEEIVVHALIPLTGGLSQSGEPSKEVLQIAEDDINQYYSDIGNPTRVKIVFHDTRTDPATARTLAEQLHTNGTKVIIGYISSAEIEAMKPYTDANGMVVLTTGSTTPSLAIPDDSIYRMVSDDTAQVSVMAYWLSQEKIRAVVPVWRGEIWGDGLTNAIWDAFSDQKGVTLEGVRYDPETTDFTAVVSSLDIITGEAINTYGAESVGVFAVTFNEIADIMDAASVKPNLTRVRWFGSDGNTGVSSLTGTTPAARFAAQVKFTGMIWGIPVTSRDHPLYKQLVNQLESSLQGDVISLYDTVWVAGMVQEEAENAMNRDQLVRSLTWVLGSFRGVSGDLTPDAAGDRGLASYNIVQVRTGPTGSQWNQITQIIIWPGSAGPVLLPYP